MGLLGSIFGRFLFFVNCTFVCSMFKHAQKRQRFMGMVTFLAFSIFKKSQPGPKIIQLILLSHRLYFFCSFLCTIAQLVSISNYFNIIQLGRALYHRWNRVLVVIFEAVVFHAIPYVLKTYKHCKLGFYFVYQIYYNQINTKYKEQWGCNLQLIAIF